MVLNRPLYFVAPVAIVFSTAIFVSSLAQPIPDLSRVSFYPASFSVYSGEKSVLFIEIKNDGDNDISNLTISLEPEVEFIKNIEPQSTNNLQSGMSKHIKLTLMPPKSIFKKEHEITITAASKDYDFRQEINITVLPYKGFWTLAAIILALCIITLFALVYLIMQKE